MAWAPCRPKRLLGYCTMSPLTTVYASFTVLVLFYYTHLHGFHWTLLRYNVSKHVWWFYNSLPHPAPGYADVYQAQAKKVVLYVEDVMRNVYRAKNPSHILLSNGYVAADPVIIETCRQEGPLKCGVIGCNLMELFMRRKYVKRGVYLPWLQDCTVRKCLSGLLI